MARLKLVLAFLSLIILAIGLAVTVYFWQHFMGPNISMTRQIAGKGLVKKEKPDLGKRHFDDAIQLLKDGELVSGRDRLLYLMDYYPESKTIDEAKRILGEVNLDLLISRIPMKGKSEHVVRRGEALVTIARRSKSTINYIMRANGKTTALIYPDESLTVYPLDFTVDISLARKVLLLRRDGLFFKEYKILDKNFPAEFGKTAATSISEKVAWYGDRPINFQDKNYLGSNKWIRTGKMGLFIRPVIDESNKGKAKPYGVMLAKSDVEELFTILRVGSAVNLVK